MNDPTASHDHRAHAALDGAVDRLGRRIIEVRRYLHAHPEASGEEFRTTSYLQDIFEEAGVQFRLLPGGRGLICDRPVRGASGTIQALRADIDALRMQDEKTVIYRSQEANLMHACGHDAHAAMAVGAVLALHEADALLPPDFAWRALFQPAEETCRGALEMIAAGALEGVGGLVALHVDPTLLAGEVGCRGGVLTASVDEFTITVKGAGGHGARPHTTRDPLAAACQFVNLVYTQIPRLVDARRPTVVSFGVFQGGVNPNAIPESVQLRGTIRTIEPGGYLEVIDQLQRLSAGLSQALGIVFEFEFDDHLGPVTNDAQLVALCRGVAEESAPGGVHEILLPSMGGEDFAYYLEHVRGVMLRLGTGFRDRPSAHLHSPRFDVDEAALGLGARLLARSVLGFHDAGVAPKSPRPASIPVYRPHE
jgi:amidohydrolase